MSSIRMIRCAQPVPDPGGMADRTDFTSSHYRLDEVERGLAIYSVLRPDASPTIVFNGQILCCVVDP